MNLANKWSGLVAASLGLFLGTLDVTVNVALPEITASFATDVETIQWIIVFYVGATTGLQLGLGSAVDLYGLRKFYLGGVAVYTLAVLLIGLADETLSSVFALRVLQAVGNGLILASAPGLVTRLFPARERGRALGVMAAIGTLGLIAGSIGGGLLVDAFGWPSIFLARVPLCVATFGFAFFALKEAPAGASPDDTGVVKLSLPGFDVAGALTSFVAFVTLILFLTLGGRRGWADPTVIGLGAAAAIFLAAFGYFERRAARPLLDLALLGDRVLLPAVVNALLLFMATFVNLFIFPFYAVSVLGTSATTLGVLLVLMPIVSAVVAPFGGWLSDRMSAAHLSTAATAATVAVLYALSRLDEQSSVVEVGVRMGLLGIGFGVFQAANASLVMGSVTADRLGMGGSILALSRGLGSVTSVAVLSAVFAGLLDSHGGDGDAFAAAFRGTYLIATAVAAVALPISLLCWPPRNRGIMDTSV